MQTRPTSTLKCIAGTSLGRSILAAAAFVCAFAFAASPAFANAPNPTSIHIDSQTLNGTSLTVTVSGTWTWDQRVPTGAQLDCNDSRIGVGYAMSWGDNQVNPLKVQNTNALLYVGTSNDDWVHSVTEGTQTVAGPFKSSPSEITESMLGETPEAVFDGLGEQGISTGASTAIPTKADAEHWFSNCGPTAQSVVNGQTIGNSNPSEPTKGYPNGTWGPISHTFTTSGPHTICPVMYDPHGSHVGLAATSEKEIIAGGTNHNNDNSVESNGNSSACVVSVVTHEPAFEAKKEQRLEGEAAYTTAKLIGKLGQKVEYKITVKDTGNTTLALGALSDPKCDAGTISAPSQASLAPGESAFYTCDHVLNAVGVYTNVAVVTATPPGEPPISHETPPVEVEVPAQPAFEIKKEQRFEGEAAYTTAKLIGKLGQRVEYKITVKNTGNGTLTLKPLVDPKCDAGTISGPSQNPIAPGESSSFTCSHVLSSLGVYTNVGTDTAEGGGKEITHTSNEVEVEAKREPAFEAKKEQRLEGEAAYTTAKLIGKLGQKVEYKITVKDTGNTTLALGALSDPKCDAGTISAPSQASLAPGESAFYTCDHVLNAVGVYTNVAVVTATPPGEPPISHETPPVEVEVPAQPAFEIKKEQRFEGEAAYTTAKLIGKLGQRVEYKITVKNTGNGTLTLKPLVDPKCDAGTISGPSQNPIAPGESSSFTCSHVLSSLGVYTNVGTDTAEGGGKEITHTSNEVEVEAKREPAFEAKKEQRLEGEAAYTTAKLIGKLGQKVEYKITVKDTGNTTLALGALSDPKCDAGTISAPSQASLAPGESAFYTCDHVLNAVGVYTNVAVVTATPPGEPPISHETPPVQTEVPAPQPAAAVLGQQAAVPALKGPQGCVRGNVVVSIKSAGVKSVTFYLDGHKLKTLSSKNAHKGRISLTIAASKISLGGHKIVAKIRMAASPTVVATRSLTVVHCGPAAIAPKFTG